MGPLLLEIAYSAATDTLRCHALQVLGFIKYGDACGLLESLLLGAVNREVRATAAYALGYIQRAESGASLSRALETDEDPNVIAQAAAALAECRAVGGLPALRAALMRAVVQEQWPTLVWVLQAIGGIGTNRDVGVLATYLDHAEVLVQEVAAKAIEAITGEDFGFEEVQAPGIFWGHEEHSKGITAARTWWQANKEDFCA